jgi:hypothetical protein
MFKIVALALVCIVGLWVMTYFCYTQGKKQGYKMRVKDLCKQSNRTFEFEDDEHNFWKVTVQAILMRRGNRSL